MDTDSPECLAIIESLREWAEKSNLGPLREEAHIHPNGRVLRWARATLTVRVNRSPRPPRGVPSGLDQEFPVLPYPENR